MKVVILKQNTDLISKYDPKIEFKKAPQPWSERFVSFTVQRTTFEKMYQYLRDRGLNPYSLLTW